MQRHISAQERKKNKRFSKIPKRTKEQDKKEYDEFTTKNIMSKIAELLPENYRGVYK